MGYIIKNGTNYFGDNSVSLTQAQYDALVQAGTVDPNTTYFIINRNTTGATYAAGIAYDKANNVFLPWVHSSLSGSVVDTVHLTELPALDS